MSQEPGQASGGDDRSNGRPARANDSRRQSPRRDFPAGGGSGRGATGGSYAGRDGASSGRPSAARPSATSRGTWSDRGAARSVGSNESGDRPASSSDSRPRYAGSQSSDRPRSSGAGRSFGSDRAPRAEGAPTSWRTRTDEQRTDEQRTDEPRNGDREGAPSRGGARSGSQGRGGARGGRLGGERSGSQGRGGERSGRPVGDRAASGRPASSRGGVDRDRTPRVERLVRKVEAPEIPEEVLASELDPDARGRLRTLSKDNADDVARHLVMAGRLIDDDPELAYRHAQVALARGGRVDIVREAAAITAYATGRYAEALREFRTVVRLNGTTEHLPLMADCERGLGRPARVLELAASPEAASLFGDPKSEMQIVVAGARADMGEYEAALHALDSIAGIGPEMRERVAEARAQIAELWDPSGRREAEQDEVSTELIDARDDEVIVYDLEDDTDE